MGERGPRVCMFLLTHESDKLFSAGSGIGTVVSFSQDANKTPDIYGIRDMAYLENKIDYGRC